MKRFSIYRNGYVNEDASIQDAKFVDSSYTQKGAEEKLMKLCSKRLCEKSDFHIVQEEKYFNEWQSIEGSEIIY